jgi:hypothetical protein
MTEAFPAAAARIYSRDVNESMVQGASRWLLYVADIILKLDSIS